ncbi:trihydrophobin [Trichoderma asperellum]|uniref:Trihydrophobin n=1 Tax=Trichoderma asperellum TaxID=101201 RepID=A0A6V8QTK7_TRIAP|nr:hypothetical protein LI328DRAFT_131560 [Trichoderma asperelloides]GFP55665.1 trihydrophobin [Trichoderma asperellum]
MQLTALLALATLAIAAPADTAEVAPRNVLTGPCSAGVTNNNPQCCGAGLLDLLYFDCETPWEISSPLNPLSTICAERGLQAKCCTLGIAGLGVLCQDALPE